MQEIIRFLKQPSTIKGIFALAAGTQIFMHPDYAQEIVGAWILLYGIFQTVRDEGKADAKSGDE